MSVTSVILMRIYCFRFILKKAVMHVIWCRPVVFHIAACFWIEFPRIWNVEAGFVNEVRQSTGNGWIWPLCVLFALTCSLDTSLLIRLQKKMRKWCSSWCAARGGQHDWWGPIRILVMQLGQRLEASGEPAGRWRLPEWKHRYRLAGQMSQSHNATAQGVKWCGSCPRTRLSQEPGGDCSLNDKKSALPAASNVCRGCVATTQKPRCEFLSRLFLDQRRGRADTDVPELASSDARRHTEHRLRRCNDGHRRHRVLGWSDEQRASAARVQCGKHDDGQSPVQQWSSLGVAGTCCLRHVQSSHARSCRWHSPVMAATPAGPGATSPSQQHVAGFSGRPLQDTYGERSLCQHVPQGRQLVAAAPESLSFVEGLVNRRFDMSRPAFFFRMVDSSSRTTNCSCSMLTHFCEPLHMTVTCSAFPFGVQDCGHLGDDFWMFSCPAPDGSTLETCYSKLRRLFGGFRLQKTGVCAVAVIYGGRYFLSRCRGWIPWLRCSYQ